MRTRSIFRAGAVAATVCVALTGCGGGAATEPSANSNGGSSPTDVDTNGHLRVGHSVPAPALNPHKVTSSAAAFPYLTPVYDWLTQMTDDDGALELAPMVATEWGLSEDGKEVVFTLRDGVTFTDGAVLDAAAVKAVLDHAKNAPGSTVASYFSMIEAVEVVDPTHVKVVANRPAADLPYVLAGVEASLISPNAFDNPDLDVKPVGSGPYIATEVKIGDSATYERREGYWDPEAQMAETITLQGLTDDNARLNALRSGQIDLMLSKVGQYPQASNLGSGFGFYSFPAAQLYTMAMNIDKPELSDPRVRQALNFAVDREGINASLLNNQCEPVGQPLTERADGHLAEPPVDYTLDPDRARKLLADAGVQDLSVTALLGAGLSPQDEIASALQAQFADIGVSLNIKPMDLVEMNGQYTAGTEPEIVNVRGGYPSSAQFLANNYGNPRLFPGTLPAEFAESLAPAFDPTLPESERTAALEGASAAVVEDAFDVPICAVPTQVAFSDKVIGASDMGVSHYLGVMDLRYVGIAQ